MKKYLIYSIIIFNLFHLPITSICWAGWNIQQIETGDWWGHECISMAIDIDNNSHITTSSKGDYGEKEHLLYIKKTGKSLETHVLEKYVYSTSIAIDNDNYPHILYPCYDVNNSTYVIKYTKRTGDSWDINTIDFTKYPCTSPSRNYFSIVIDSKKYPNVSYNKNGLKYAKWNGISWDIYTVDSSSSSIYNNSIAIDSNDYPHIAYHDGKNLKYAKWTGDSWDINTIDWEIESGSYTGRNCSIALDSNDYPHIIYDFYQDVFIKIPERGWTLTHPSFLNYIKFNGNFWEKQTISSEEMLSFSGNRYHSIKIDKNDLPHICYTDFDNTNYIIKYAKWTGNSWSTDTVNTTKYLGYGGFSIALDLDSNDYPHIAYATCWDIEYIEYDPTLCDIKGYVKDSNNIDITSVTVNLRGEVNRSYITSSTGYYEFLNLPSGNYVVTPTRYSWAFIPYKLDYFPLNSNQQNQNFTGIQINLEQNEEKDRLKIIVSNSAGLKGTINPNIGGKADIHFKGSESGIFTLRVFNLLGELVYKENKDLTPEGVFEWFPQDIASGVYIIHIEGPGGFSIHKKIPVLR